MSRRHETTVEHEVPFRDVDLARVAWHGHYYGYFELARSKLLRERKLDVHDLIQLGYGFFVIESRCRYVSPLFYGDRIRVSAWLRDTRHRVNIAYEIENLTQNAKAARGHTILATTDANRRLLIETPREIRDRLD